MHFGFVSLLVFCDKNQAVIGIILRGSTLPCFGDTSAHMLLLSICVNKALCPASGPDFDGYPLKFMLMRSAMER